MTIIALTILGSLAIAPPEGEESTHPVVEAVEAGAAEAATIPETVQPAPDAEMTLVESLRSGGVGALRKLWNDIGVESDLFSNQPDEQPLEVSESQVELDGSDGLETLLAITDGGSTDYHFLALEATSPAPAKIGSVDVRNQRSGPPMHRIELLGTRSWLVIRAVKGSGNGFSRVHEVWHAAASSLKQALSYPVDGYVNGHDMPFNRSFSGTAPRLEEADGKPVVSIDLSVRYTNGDLLDVEGLEELFTRSATVRYSLNESECVFALDEAGSGMNEAEIEGIFGDDAEGFLRHNFTQLKEMAQSADELKRRWLRLFLEGREESSEKSVLEELLGDESIITVGE